MLGRCFHCNFLLLRNERICPYCKRNIFPLFSQQPPSEEYENIIKNNHSKADIKNINLKWITIYENDFLIPAEAIKGLPTFLEKGDRIKGTVISKDDSLFDCHILDNMEYSKYLNKDYFNSIQSFEKISSAMFDLEIPYNDIWYIAFNREIKNTKTVQVIIKKTKIENRNRKP